jgi:hypothetical protein
MSQEHIKKPMQFPASVFQIQISRFATHSHAAGILHIAEQYCTAQAISLSRQGKLHFTYPGRS